MMLTTVPFAGFYCSIHDSEIDYALESAFQTENGNPIEALIARASDTIKWQEVHEAYAKAYIENFADHFKIRMKPDAKFMESPREYNFTTDRLFAVISEREVRRLRKATDERQLRTLAKECFTSRSGFMSSYSPDIDSWGGIATWDHNQVGTLVHAYANCESSYETFNTDDELDLMESARRNSEIESWILDAMKGEEAERINKVYAYLREREARKWRGYDWTAHRKEASQ